MLAAMSSIPPSVNDPAASGEVGSDAADAVPEPSARSGEPTAGSSGPTAIGPTAGDPAAVPPADDLAALLTAGDRPGIRRLFHAGRLNALRDVLGTSTWAEVPGRVDRGDLVWLRTTLGPVVDRVGHVTTATALGYEAPRFGYDPSDPFTLGRGRRATDAAGGAPSASAVGLAAGSMGAGAAGSTVAPPPSRPRRGGAGWWWLLPAAAAVAVLGLVITTGGDDNGAVSASTPTAASSIDTSAPTTPAPTAAAAPTTVATTVATSTEPPAVTTAPAPSAPAGSKDLLGTATDTGGLTAFLSALGSAQLTSTLTAAGPFTVFAPSDAAFGQLDPATFAAIQADPELLKKVLRYHLVDGRRAAADLKPGKLATVEGESLTVGQAGGGPSINDGRVTQADVPATNGVLHVIDRVLLPPSLRLGPGDATAKDLVQVLTDTGNFTVLTDLVKTAGLTDVLSGPGPFSLFAPTDTAFSKLPDGALDQLKADKAALNKLLTYHVVPGATKATDLPLGRTKTVEGDTLEIGRAKGKVTADGATVVYTDVPANNGYAHVIDRVLTPGDVDLSAILGPAEAAAPAPDFVVFFDTDSAAIRPDAADAIRQAAALVKKGTTVVLTGVADTRGRTETNVELSDRRANAVADALKANGANATFEIRAKGAEPNADLQQARRVEIDLP